MRISQHLPTKALLSAMALASSAFGADNYEYWQDQNVFTMGTIGHHCTQIPYPDAASAKSGLVATATAGNHPFEKSKWFKSLNGNWKFNWVDNAANRPKDFYYPNYADSEWTEIPVPSCWERLGYGQPFHTAMDRKSLFPL